MAIVVGARNVPCSSCGLTVARLSWAVNASSVQGVGMFALLPLVKSWGPGPWRAVENHPCGAGGTISGQLSLQVLVAVLLVPR